MLFASIFCFKAFSLHHLIKDQEEVGPSDARTPLDDVDG